MNSTEMKIPMLIKFSAEIRVCKPELAIQTSEKTVSMFIEELFRPFVDSYKNTTESKISNVEVEFVEVR